MLTLLNAVAAVVGPFVADARFDHSARDPDQIVYPLQEPYAMVKVHAGGGVWTTSVVQKRNAAHGVMNPCVWIDDKQAPDVISDFQRVVVRDDGWLVALDGRSRYWVLDLREEVANPLEAHTLSEANALLAERQAAPVREADFQTFNELRDERNRLPLVTTAYIFGAVLVGWLAVLGVALPKWQRASRVEPARPRCPA